MKSIIRNFIAKLMAGRSDDGIMITLKDPQKVTLAENIMMDTLMRNGIDPASIKNETQLKNILEQIKIVNERKMRDLDVSGIRNTESAKLFEITTGKEIPKGSKIMGGKAVDDMPPPGSRGGKDDIAAPVQSSEESLKNMIEAENKKNIAKMKERKMQRESLEDFVDDAGGVNPDDPRGIDDFIPDDDPEPLAKGGIARIGLASGTIPGGYTKDAYKYLREMEMDIKKSYKKYKAGGGTLDFDTYSEMSKETMFNADFPSFRADGGRIGLKDGMNRRTFMKIFSGLVALPIIGKVIKPLKLATGVKKVPIIKTDDVAGKPEWFDQLVNKVILEGDDVTKRFATKEREIVHAKQIDEDNYVTVTQDLDEGVVRVEYENPYATMFGEKVDMTYKKPLPDEGDPRPVGEFQTQESGIVGRAQGPDDYDLEIEGMSGRAIEDLESDVSALKQYATGKKPTLKEIVQNKKRRDKVSYYETPEGQSEYVVQRQGEYDYSPDDGMASGGIARMLGE